MAKSHAPFFQGKICEICKRPAKMFRIMEGRQYMLCDSKACDFITKDRAGFFKNNVLEKKK